LATCIKKTGKIPFETFFPGIEKDALDLMKKLLCFDSQERLSAEQALSHPYFSDLHNLALEPTHAPIDYFDFEFE
jgi:serine/threonine protein kinase